MTFLDKLVPSKTNFFTILIIAANVMVFSFLLMNGGIDYHNLIRFGALSPSHIHNNHQYHRLFTGFFLHKGTTHLLVNMLMLYIFGSKVEKYYGNRLFILIYFGSGVFGSIFSLFFSAAVSVGASTAIFGLVGAVLVIQDNVEGSIQLLKYVIMLILVLINIADSYVAPGTDNFAHLGGLVSGIIIGYVLCKRSTT